MSLERDQVSEALPAYDVGEELGRGAWGIVLRGEHRKLGRPVAIKQLPRAFAADPAVQRRFAAEARLLAGLDHPHIVRVYDYVERAGLCLLVMELLSGGTVWDRLSADAVPPEAACGIALATCCALDYAHSRGILHRDIKPENLLFGAAGDLKVSDFGIAKVLGGSETLTTSGGQMLGTPAYIAPEQVLGREPSPATDVYAVGMLLYELLAGRLPFEEEGGLASLLYRHVHERPRPLHEVAPDVPRAIADVTMTTLATEPADRHPSAEELGLQLVDAAEAAWGPGWLRRSGLSVMAAGRIAVRLSASESATAAGRVPGTLIETEPTPLDVRRPRPPWRGYGRRIAAVLAAMAVVAAAAAAVVFHPFPGPVPPHVSTSPSPGMLVFSDDFSKPSTGWAPDQGQAGAGSASFRADGYHVVALQSENPLSTFSVASPYTVRITSVAVVAEGTMLADSPADGWGVRCDQGGRSGLRYTFEVHGDGSWVVFKIDGVGSAAIAQGQSRAISTGASANRVRGECTELAGATRLTISVNGTMVADAMDAHPGGPIGWHAALVLYRDRSSAAAEVRFTAFQTFDISRSST